jgi:cytochrome c2
LGLAGCEDDAPARMEAAAGGDARLGRLAVQAHGCTACHTIPGISGPHGRTGPALDGFARRVYIAGIVPNRPDMLTRWLLDPPALAPRTAMPNVGLTAEEAGDIATFLYTLE